MARRIGVGVKQMVQRWITRECAAEEDEQGQDCHHAGRRAARETPIQRLSLQSQSICNKSELVPKRKKFSSTGIDLRARADSLMLSTVNDFGKLLIVTGVIVTAIGVVLWSGIARNWLGRLPGDIHYTSHNFSFHFPIVTCLLLSVVLSIILWLFRK